MALNDRLLFAIKQSQTALPLYAIKGRMPECH